MRIIKAFQTHASWLWFYNCPFNMLEKTSDLKHDDNMDTSLTHWITQSAAKVKIYISFHYSIFIISCAGAVLYLPSPPICQSKLSSVQSAPPPLLSNYTSLSSTLKWKVQRETPAAFRHCWKYHQVARVCELNTPRTYYRMFSLLLMILSRFWGLGQYFLFYFWRISPLVSCLCSFPAFFW